MIFKEIAPMVMALTLLISILIITKIKKPVIYTIDGKFAIIGTVLGMLITSLNLIYSNNYIITLGPLLTIACLIYLSNRDKLLIENKEQIFTLDKKTLNITRTIYWICITIALLAYQFAEPYYRPPIFFVSISIAVASLGVEILSFDSKNKISLCKLFSKILTLSLILRLSAYYISSYPIGSDPWVHAELIKDITKYGISYFPTTHDYYSNYPIMHIFSSVSGIVMNLSSKESMAVVGITLMVSTFFVYLIIRDMTNNTNLALFSMLLLNFSDFHIQWGVQVIAMTFGITIFTILLYLLLIKRTQYNSTFKLFLIVFIFLIIWTHTISTFIYMVLLFSLFIGRFLYKLIYAPFNQPSHFGITITICVLSIVILIYHWMDPRYPFMESITRGLIESLSKEAGFLNRTASSNIENSWNSIFNIMGFLTLVFFGVIGSLHSLSKKYGSEVKFVLIYSLTSLFFVFFVFPVLGIRNIIPYRWPVFIYSILVIFTGIGIFKIINIPKRKQYSIIILFLSLLLSSFFMITNSITNMDSPIYGGEINEKLVWTDSEMSLFSATDQLYLNYIISDRQTRRRPFKAYFKRDNVTEYSSIGSAINLDNMDDYLIVWRKSTIERPIQVGYTMILPGNEFKTNLDDNFSNVYDTGLAKAYISNK